MQFSREFINGFGPEISEEDKQALTISGPSEPGRDVAMQSGGVREEVLEPHRGGTPENWDDEEV